MALFAKRPLAAGFAAAIFTVIFSELFSFPLIQAFLLLGALLFLAFLVLTVTHRRKPATVFLLLVALGVLAGSLRVLPIHQRERALRNAIGKETLAVAEVEEMLASGSYGSEMLVSVKRLDGRTVSGKAILKTEEIAPFIVGDRVTAVCTVKSLNADAYVENRHLYYRAEGAAVQLALTGDVNHVVPAEKEGGLSLYLERIRTRVVGRVRTHIDGDAGDLAVAMLLASRPSLSGSVTSDFRQAGVSHLLALSGLHLGILALLVERLLLGVGFSRRWRIFLLSSLVFGYLLLTGLPTSLLRAALMLFMVQLSFLLRTRADTLTSLFFAAAVLLLLTPTAMFSPSMQMTLLATFGILTIGKLARVLFGRRYMKPGIGNKLLFWVPSSMLLTLAASLFTYPVQCFTFGEVSLMTPLSNLLMIPVATLFLYLATMAMLLFPAAFFGKLATWVGNLLLFLARALGHDAAVISLKGDYVPYLVVITTALTAILLILRLKRPLLVLLPHVVATGVFFAILLSRTVYLHDKVAVVYGNEKGTEAILVQADGETLLVDLGASKSAALSLGGALLDTLDRTGLDYYLVTDPTCLTENRLAAISAKLAPHTLLLPKPTVEEGESFEILIARAAAYGLQVEIYEQNQTFSPLEGAKMTARASVEGTELLIRGRRESLSYQSAAAIGQSDAVYQILSSGDALSGEFVTHGADATVVVADEQTLAALVTHSDAAYILFPEKQGFLLQ